MLKQLQKRNESGFTIIEVMIVLAIAGVIMMLVFLAIPALQRNNRNTQLRNDVANLLGYVSEYTSNNNGALPGEISADVTTGDVSMGANASSATVVGQIRGGTNVNEGDENTATGTTDTIIVHVGASCNDDGSVSDDSDRSVAATFAIETAGGTQAQCQEN